MWDLRREWPEGPLGDDGFSALLGRYGIDGEQAQRQIRVWDHARKHRKLRELADEAPGQAMEFVGRLARLGGDALPGPDEDPEVARIMTMPPRAMTRAIRRLLDARTGPDVPLDAGEPADGGASSAGVARLPRATPESAHRAAVECEEKLAALAALVEDLPARRKSPAWVGRMLRLLDMMNGHLDRAFAVGFEDGGERWWRRRLMLSAAAKQAIRSALASAPRGCRGAEAKRLAALYGCSPATVYRAASVGGAKRPRGR